MIERARNIPISAEVLGSGLMITFESGEIRAYASECLPDPRLAKKVTFRNGFTQRFDKYGIGDSYCLCCLARVGSSRPSFLLRRAEALHSCWQREEINAAEERSPPGRGLRRVAHRILAALGFCLLLPLFVADRLLTTAVILFTRPRNRRPHPGLPVEDSRMRGYRDSNRQSTADWSMTQ